MNDLRRVSDFLNETLEFQEILDVFKRKFREFVVDAKYLDFTVAYRKKDRIVTKGNYVSNNGLGWAPTGIFSPQLLPDL